MITDCLGRMKLALAVGLVLGLATGCRDPHDAGHDHDSDSAQWDHDHEELTHRVTTWSDRFEIFAEFEPVTAGRAFELVTHVTSLETREPRRGGPLRLMLRRGGRVVKLVTDQPAQPGIYLTEVTLDEAGSWEMSIDFPGMDGGGTVRLPAIEVHADAHDAAHAEVAPVPDGISFLKEQQWRIRLGTERASRRRLVERLVFHGQVSAKPGSSAVVVAPMAGQIAGSGGRPFPRLGDRVEEGQVLAMLEPRFSEAAARLSEFEAGRVQARTALEQAQAAFDRVQRLAAEQAKSQRELQEAAADVAMAQARLDAAMALQSTYRRPDGKSVGIADIMPALELRAPIAGMINRIHAGMGEVVGPETVVFQVIDPEVVWLEARIPESSLARIHATEDALYERPDALGQYTAIEGAAGKFLGFELDPVTRTAPLTFEVRNRDGALRVGQSVRLHVATAAVAEALALPDSAIVEESGRPVALVQVSGETFAKRDLVLGIRDGRWVQVLEGVDEGERVVTEGAYVVRLVSVSSELPAHGHAH
jgi:membrane fusion protein, heavy metal efflux system